MKKTDTADLLTILFTIFPVYILYTLITYETYLENLSFYQYPDQNSFFEWSEILGESKNVGEIFRLCFIDRVHVENEGFFFLLGLISYIANVFFDGNSVILQIVHVSFFAILTNLIVYKFLKNNGIRDNALKFTLIYALFTPILYYSTWILRDIHLAFFYSLSLLLATSSFKLKRLLLFIPLIFITAEFRLEHGLFMLVFVFYYVFYKGRDSKYFKIIRSSVIIISVFVLSIIILPLVQEIVEILKWYNTYTIENTSDEGLGIYLLRLPPVIKQIAMSFYSQLIDFPPWLKIKSATTFSQTIIGIVSMIKSIFWSILFLTCLISIFNKNIRKSIDRERIVLLFIFLLFLLLNSSNMHDRRIFAMYPVLFLYNSSMINLHNKSYLKIKRLSINVYILLILFYILMKFITS
ncbi:MAG: hypothetical protein PHT02_13615 [Tissierellia bacterium]|nr:hypothetical protein [Tissierellia bacterium]